MEKGRPNDPRFPERDNEWMCARTKERDLLIEWLEGFKASFMEYEEAQNCIQECEAALQLYRSVIDPIRVPLMIQNARNARAKHGSCLEFGLEYHLKNFLAAVCHSLLYLILTHNCFLA